MAMKKCRECGHSISSSAKVCRILRSKKTLYFAAQRSLFAGSNWMDWVDRVY